MKTLPSAQCSVLSLVVMIAMGGLGHAQEKKAGPPVEFPKLEHFKPLWERSIFTTKDLPSPDAPAGPNFADNLSLSGVYEIDGAVVAVLVDRVTSQIMEARIGSENEMGIKIRKVTPGETVDKTRIQLQKGDQAGWVSFAEAEAPQPAEVIQRAVIPTQQQQQPGGGGAMSAPQAVSAGMQGQPSPQPRRAVPPQPTGLIPPVNPILPPPTATPRAPGPVNDVPLPPP